MKKIVFVLMSAFPLMGIAQTAVQSGYNVKPQQYKIKGDVSKIQDPARKIVVSSLIDGKRNIDTLAIENGSFTLKGTLNEPVRFSLRLMVDSAEAAAKGINRRPSMSRDYLTVFVEKGDVQVITVDSFSNSTVKGSRVHDEYVKVTAAAKQYVDAQNEASKQYSELYRLKDTAAINKLLPKFSEFDKEIRRVNKEYIQKNPSSPYAIFALSTAAGYDIDAAEVEPLFNLLPAATKESSSGKAMLAKIDIAKKTSVGMMAMDFTQNDTSGIPVKLSSFRGKYLLVDFWASWCGPCRKENPNIVKAFEKYKSKGFDILGVSLDRPGQKDRWMKAIYDDKLMWTQVSDLKWWENDVAKQYGIQSIPQSYLLDPNGKIIAKNLRGEDLEKKLAELFPSN